MPHAYLVTLTELELYGLSWEFLDQFRPQPLDILISTAGALGTMQFQWRRRGETAYSVALVSNPTGPWAKRLSDAYADLTFAAGTYVLNSTYAIDESGVVTLGGGAINTVTAARFDLRLQALQTATDSALGWMSPIVVPPVTAWGSDVRARTAHVVAYLLKSIKGMAPSSAAIGEENLRARYLDAEEWFKGVGRGTIDPQDLVDSSPSAAGGGLLAYPVSDTARGW